MCNNVFKFLKLRFFSEPFSMKWSNATRSALSAGILGFLSLGIASTSAIAQTNPATITFGVSAMVLKDCVVSATAMAFGNYTGAINSVQSTVTVTCTNTTTYTVGLNAGTTSGGSAANPRLMAGPSGATLAYGLYQNATWTTNWGNATGSWVSGTGNGAAQPLTVYGQIAAGLHVTPGSYTDTITATVTY